MEECGMLEHIMVSPASSPDINPIENVWSAMKDFLQRKVKPKTNDQLVSGIEAYWETLTVQKCRTFIDHIHKVLSVVVLNNGKKSKKISNDQELIQSDPISCPQNQKRK